jgi:crotonobetainyl-CoA:carnitine CoA-transferase CaiB-like acyl-CoA transferase
VLGFEQLATDPQIVHNEVVVEREHPTAGRLREVRHPVRYGVTSPVLPPIAPLHGEHTDAVLASLGYDGAAIQSLRDDGVIG